jgi:curli production assembly/transport component CsgE
LVALPLCAHSQNIQSSECEQFQTYKVENSESLQDISLRFGSAQFEPIIYQYNADVIKDKSSIPAGTSLIIPINIVKFTDSGLPIDEVLQNPACPKSAIQNNSEEKQTTDQEMLEKFREAFRELTEEEADTVVDQSHVEAEKNILTGISGMVIDETRSKIGRDFYDVFYQNWTAPEAVSGFTITISEQPAPGLGTIISVKANDTETFKYRLQPRYEFIQQAGKYAVNITQNYLKNNPQDFVIY